jgi:hypothetical protein
MESNLAIPFFHNTINSRDALCHFPKVIDAAANQSPLHPLAAGFTFYQSTFHDLATINTALKAMASIIDFPVHYIVATSTIQHQ